MQSKLLSRLIIFVVLGFLVIVVSRILGFTGTAHRLSATATLDPDTKDLVALMLSARDVPDSWYDDGEYFAADKPTARGLSHLFLGTTTKSTIRLTQYLRIYTDIQSANNDFMSEAALFAQYPQEWHDVSGLAYQPRADQFQFSCMSLILNGTPVQDCRALQRYGRYLSLIYVSVDGNYMTMPQVEKILESVDQKLMVLNASSQTP